MLHRRRRNGLLKTGYMVEMCAIVLPIAKIKLEIAEVVLEHGAGTWCNGAAQYGSIRPLRGSPLAPGNLTARSLNPQPSS